MTQSSEHDEPAQPIRDAAEREAGVQEGAVQNPVPPRRARKQPKPGDYSLRQQKAISGAGGWSLGFFSMGVNLVLFVAVVSLLIVFVRWVVVDVFGSLGASWGDAVVEWVDAVDFTVIGLIAVLLVLVAAALMGLGVWLSQRSLTRAGVANPMRVTWLGVLLGTVLQFALGAVGGWLTGLVGIISGFVSIPVLLLLYAVVSTVISFAVGWLAGDRFWLWLARRQLPRSAR